MVSLRSAGSYLDATYPAARIGERFFRGSGTSQAAAVVSGAAALLISQRPGLTPDQVKALLTRLCVADLPSASATPRARVCSTCAAARAAPTPVNATQTFAVSTGVGSLELSRGSVHVTVGGRTVRGEVDVRGRSFDARNWAAGLRNGQLERHDLVRHDLVRHDLVGHDLVRHDLVGHDLVRHDVVGHDLERHDVVGHDLVRHDLVGHDLVRHDLVRGRVEP